MPPLHCFPVSEAGPTATLETSPYDYRRAVTPNTPLWVRGTKTQIRAISESRRPPTFYAR
jgi:hypothetical protein